MPTLIKPNFSYRKGWQHSFLEAEKSEDSWIGVVMVVTGAVFLFALSPWLGAAVVVGSIGKLVWGIQKECAADRKLMAEYEALGPIMRSYLDRGYVLKEYKG